MALVLTRKIGESVVLYGDVYCTVLGVNGNQVRLGFEAPKRIVINREEIHNRILMDKAEKLKEKGARPSVQTVSSLQFKTRENNNLTH